MTNTQGDETRNLTELPPVAQIPTATKSTKVLRRPYTVLDIKNLERCWNVSLTYWNKLRLFKHNFAQTTQNCVGNVASTYNFFKVRSPAQLWAGVIKSLLVSINMPALNYAP
ncbi:hypothetical protein ACTXGK_12795 [Psychrobacter sp. T6-5]|uniref:hypothetical protein n=1 Tax=Psychrobacter sp. T6-5 TaxID=3457451 RepID=UPI003FD391BF